MPHRIGEEKVENIRDANMLLGPYKPYQDKANFRKTLFIASAVSALALGIFAIVKFTKITGAMITFAATIGFAGQVAALVVLILLAALVAIRLGLAYKHSQDNGPLERTFLGIPSGEAAV